MNGFPSGRRRVIRTSDGDRRRWRRSYINVRNPTLQSIAIDVCGGIATKQGARSRRGRVHVYCGAKVEKGDMPYTMFLWFQFPEYFTEDAANFQGISSMKDDFLRGYCCMVLSKYNCFRLYIFV
jgi:hypothetical protein